jgi:hypothetical protein
MLKRHAATIPVLLAVLAGVAVLALPAQASAAKSPCWERVTDDWLDNGRIDGTFSVACYQQALKHLPEDLRDYSDVADVINAAMQNALRNPSGKGSGPDSNGPGTAGPDGAKPRTPQASPGGSPYRNAINNLGRTSTDSLPIPLLVLAGLGTLLLITAGGMTMTKRIRGRAKPPPTR